MDEIVPYTITLNNGLKISHIYNGCKLFQIEMIVRAGMLDETKEQFGFAHFIEHIMSFFTSKKYPDSLLNQQMLNYFGLETNAWTTETDCGYYVTGNVKHFINVVDLIFQNYIDPTLDKKIFEQEKTAVIRELTKLTTNGWYILENMIQKVQYKGTVLENSIHYEKKNIKKNAKLENILEFRHTFYRPEITNVIITSNHSRKKFNKLCNHINKLYFNRTQAQARIQPSRGIKKPQRQIQTERLYYYAPSNNEGTYRIHITFPIPFSIFDLRLAAALEYIENILTGGLGSRLYFAIRSDLGAVYNIDSHAYFNFKDKQYNYFTIETETDEEKLIKVHDRIMIELGIITSKYITPTEMNEKKNVDRVENEYNLCSSSFQKHTEFYQPFLIWGSGTEADNPTLSQWLKIKESITYDDILKVSQMVFNDDKMIVFYSGEKRILKHKGKHITQS